jgi:hypothetical protein
MNRRDVLQLLALSGAWLISLKGKAFAQAGAQAPLLTGAAAEQAQASGLPADWSFVVPRQWTRVEQSLAARLSLRDTAPIDLGGIRVMRSSGKIEGGQLAPVGSSVELPDSLAGIVLPADEALSLEALNAEFNPFLEDPRGADGEPLIGPITAGGEIYQGKALLPVRFIMTKMIEASGLPPAAMQHLLDAMTETVAIRTPAHQFRLGDGLGNRVVFYGEAEVDGETIDVGHTHIDQVVIALAGKHLRLIKQMVHFDLPGQGGSPEDIVADATAGSTHAGGFSAGYDPEGKPMAIKSDWPSNYGILGNNNKTYNAHLIAIDYRAGVEDPIPEEALKAYYRNADMWDCASAIIVPFADQDPDPQFRDYMYNPLELFDQKSARDVAASLAELDKNTFFEKHGAFYCAEGQYVVANLGPQEDEQGGTLLKRSRYGGTPLGRLIDNFIAAPGYAGMSSEQRRRKPAIGWEHLVALGPETGGISRGQAAILTATHRHGITLDWIPEHIKGWQAYRPKNPEALIARPMTVATLAWALLRLYMPRDAVARAIAADLGRAYAQGDEAVKASVVALAGGSDPSTPAGQAMLATVSAKAATGLLLGLLASDEVTASLLSKGGFNEISNDADKAKVLAAYQEFLGILQNADYSTQSSLDRALAEADAKLDKLTVMRSFYSRVLRERTPTKSTVMKYAAPPCFGMWAQQPFLAGTGCLRYVATAMHLSQKKGAAS